MNEDVKQLLSRHPGFHSNFFLDSQVYFIGKINGVAQLFEIYQICKNGNPTINYLATVTNNQSSIAYIWENRRNLGQCVLRVGYLEFVRDVVKLSNDTLIEANTMIEALQSKKMRIQTQLKIWKSVTKNAKLNFRNTRVLSRKEMTWMRRK